MVYKKVSDEELTRLFNLYGYDIELLSNVSGLHKATVRKRLVSLELVQPHSVLTDGELISLFNEFDGDVKKVIEATGLHRNTIHKRLKLLGLIEETRKVSDIDIIEACNSSINMRAACDKLGMGMYAFKRRAKHLGVYRGINKKREPSSLGYELDDILNGKHPTYNIHRLKLRLYEAKIFKDECSKCGFNEHREGFEHSVCQLHHINGDPRDHRLENLEILCPNCHALTPNFGFSKRYE